MFSFLAGGQIQCVGTSFFQIREISCPCLWCFASQSETRAMFGLPIRRARAPRISQSGPSFQIPHIRTFPPARPRPTQENTQRQGKIYTPTSPLSETPFIQILAVFLQSSIASSRLPKLAPDFGRVYRAKFQDWIVRSKLPLLSVGYWVYGVAVKAWGGRAGSLWVLMGEPYLAPMP